LVVYAAVVAFEHSNTNLSFGPLNRVFCSPNYHRIHHRVEGRQDVNLGFALTIWDQLSGRAVFPTKETIRIDTGLPGRPLAVEQSAPRARHFSVLAAQLLGPFRPLNERVVAENRSEFVSSRDRAVSDAAQSGRGTSDHFDDTAFNRGNR
jgi:hypothetical protein